MTIDVRVHLLPQLFEPAELAGGVAVVIDILRATTTIVHAVNAGVQRVVPCAEVETARQLAAQFPAGSVLLGGERRGERIAGFDLDNSPLKYTPDVVRGKSLIFTTTNGTRALERCKQAERILIGAFVNRAALLAQLQAESRTVHLVCAGTAGGITSEDALFAGAIAYALLTPGSPAPDDQTQLAIALWQACLDDPGELLRTLRQSRGGRNLLELGYAADIDRAAQCDLFSDVPEFDLAAGQISGTN